MSDTKDLPPISDKNFEKGERIFRTALDSSYYLRLDSEALSRGLRPYGLVKILLTAYLDGRLVYLKELPEPIQVAIKKVQAQRTQAL
jgi:hypothetical protein